MQYPNEFMMAAIVASTALVGLTGVVIGQIRGSSKISTAKRRRYSTLFVLLPLVLGLVTTIVGMGWFNKPNIIYSLIVRVMFGSQLVSFFGISAWVWLIERA